MAIACAAIADVSAWVILAFVIALVRGDSDSAFGTFAFTLGATFVYVVAMFLLVRPVLRRFWERRQAARGSGATETTQDDLTIVLLIVLISAFITEAIHIHALFGGFVAGVVMPPDRHLREAIAARLEDLLGVLLLPIFFAYAGIRANVTTMSTAADWMFCAAAVGVAVTSKLGGGMFAARAAGVPWRESAALGVLMNARGLIELVLLTIGLQEGIITPDLYTIMVIMAIVTTVMTTPLLAMLVPTSRETSGSRILE